MVAFEVPEVDYTRYSNRQLIAVPLAVLGVALLVLLAWTFLNGAPVNMGTDFTGGTQLRVAVTDGGGEAAIRSAFDQEISEVQYAQASGEYIVTFGPDADSQAVESAVSSASNLENRGLNQISPSFGESVQRTALIGVGVAFLGMSVLVFALFRTFVPSIAVVLSAFSDIVIPVALMNVFGIELTLGTVAALLMIIGYSVDSDILLNTHVLRRSGDFYESTYRAMRTGVTMTITSLCAMAAMAFTAWLFGVQLLTAIGLVLVFGLAADLMNTYMMNVTLLRWYVYEGVNR
ncbi:protein translocase subunit SecF [Halomicrobium urmianum]|uniref:protein translocase subunit SecF n=1 Tax=Halomicrobium urmianum TaxID=1586233 RepID=UPI001CD96E35|nr:protein translocase subunit SecF [Halomicrobium urmianum]